MNNNDDITVLNFGTGLWGVSNVTIRTDIISDDIDLVDSSNTDNIITISGSLARAIADVVNNSKEL